MAVSRIVRTGSLSLSAVLLSALSFPVQGAAQTNADPQAPPATQENTLPGGADSTTLRDDGYLRLPVDSVREDPFMRRLARTSRSAERTDKAVAVMDRQRPDYDPVGMPVGSFNFFPALTAAGNATNNVFRQSDEDADAWLSARAEGVLKSDWGRHALSVDGFLQKDLHIDHRTENNFSYRARATGMLEISDGNFVNGRLSHERVVQDRGSTGDILATRKPVRYDESYAELGGRLGGQTRFSGKLNLGYRVRNYVDSVTPDGLPFDQDFRNYKDYIAAGQAGYRIGAEKELFLSLSHTWRRFDNDVPERRDVNVIEVLGGIEGDVTPVIRGRFGLGYLSANFLSTTIKDQKGLAVDARLDFMVTELTTVRVDARRELRNVAGVNSNSATATVGRIGVDHELYRNVILSPSLSYEVADYVGSDRDIKLFVGDLSARWLINRRLRANASATYRKRNSGGFVIGRDFSAFDVSAGLTWQL